MDVFVCIGKLWWGGLVCWTGDYNQGASNMLGAYRTTSFTDHYPRVAPLLRSPHGAAGWTPFGSQLESIRNPVTGVRHSSHNARTSLSRLHRSRSPAAPQLVRTSVLNQPGGNGSGGGGYNPYPGLYPAKATLTISGDLGSMAENWTQEEWKIGRASCRERV